MSKKQEFRKKLKSIALDFEKQIFTIHVNSFLAVQENTSTNHHSLFIVLCCKIFSIDYHDSFRKTRVHRSIS